MYRRPAIPLQVRITALVLLVLIIGGVTGGAVLVRKTLLVLDDDLGQRALFIARTLAQTFEIRKFVGTPGAEAVIQPLAERARLATGVEYVVVIDMNGIRYSHPIPDRIGTRFEGGDEGPALGQQSYVSRAIGPRGASMRAFVPVFDIAGPVQVGVVVVGVLEPSLGELLNALQAEILLATVVALTITVLGASLLARSIKREIFNLEPVEIARLLEERVAVFSAIGEGLVAIDRAGRITVFNQEAERMLGVGPEAVGRPVTEIIPNSQLPEVAESGRIDKNRPMRLGSVMVLANRVPIRVKGKTVGAVATFRDRTEVQALAEQVTGVERFVDALRASNHEWMNKLHTVAGLVRLRKYKQAIEFIFSATEGQQDLARFLAKRFADPRLAGLLLGKFSRARELGITLEVDPNSRLGAGAEVGHVDTVLLLGNLIENAMDALSTHAAGELRVHCRVQEEDDGVSIEVTDNGPGVPPELQTAIFRQGVSTKGPGRGTGLALVRQEVELAGGEIRLESVPGNTRFTIRLPRLAAAQSGGETALGL